MGKKNRRRDANKRSGKRGPGADEQIMLDRLEKNDPTYEVYDTLPIHFQRMLLRYRFGGFGSAKHDWRGVKITAALVREVREARARSSQDEFEGENNIWEARNAMALDESDGLALDEYIGTVVGLQFANMIGQMQARVDSRCITSVELKHRHLDLNTIRRWPRVRPHWQRFRRRLCHNCPRYAHLTEPRYMVCSGCGVARYCSEACQAEHWPYHQEECLACQELITRRQRQREILARRGIHTGDTSDDDGDVRTSDEEDDSLDSLPSDPGSDA